jgi:hypothetical protein
MVDDGLENEAATVDATLDPVNLDAKLGDK